MLLSAQNVEHKFDSVAEDPRFKFFGNVNITSSSSQVDSDSYHYAHATQLPLSSLLPHYTHLLLSYGSSLPRPLGIPGSDPGELANVHSALDFVNWYNGHPAAHDENLLSQAPWRRISFPEFPSSSSNNHMTVVGAGNVALDVARIVLRASLLVSNSSSSNREALAKTDVPEPVLASLSSSNIKRVDVFARRGPAQLAMTNKEVREMMALEGISFSGVPEQELQDAREEVEVKEKEDEQAGRSEGKGEARVRKRLLDLLKKGSKETFKAGDDGQSSWGLNFFRAPKAFKSQEGTAQDAQGVAAVRRVEWNVTSFSKPPSTEASTSNSSLPPSTEEEKSLAARTAAWGNDPDPSGSIAAVTPNVHAAKPTGQTEATSTDMIVSSVGYRSTPLDGNQTSNPTSISTTQSTTFQLPFDSKQHLIPNSSGRVLLPSSASSVIPGIYVSGWLARGPVGVIASTMYDAYSVADLITSDWRSTAADQQKSLSSKLGLQGSENFFDSSSSPPELSDTQQRVVSYQDWKRLDTEELRQGKELGKLREKLLCECVSFFLPFDLLDTFTN